MLVAIPISAVGPCRTFNDDINVSFWGKADIVMSAFDFLQKSSVTGANPQCAKNAQFGKVPAIGVEALHG